MNTLSTQCADIRDILTVFVVTSECLRQRLKGFMVKYSIFGKFRNIYLI